MEIDNFEEKNIFMKYFPHNNYDVILNNLSKKFKTKEKKSLDDN